ncbi:MAG TPA: hypothetical protein DCP37_02230 [Dehalococcoidia bacterium]|nr:hypothetical protein [SAR202 cluster bacterium]HAL46551.1 hypothetical protein [Dehalococcoidia bacterium]
MRSTTVAAAMNVVPIGLGYLYLKEYSRFAFTFFGGVTGLFTAVVLTGPLSLGPCFHGVVHDHRTAPGLVANGDTGHPQPHHDDRRVQTPSQSAQALRVSAVLQSCRD